MTQFQIQSIGETQYAQIVSRNAGEFQPSRQTRPSATPALQEGFFPSQLTEKSAQPTRRALNYPQIEIGPKPVIESPPPAEPELTPPELGCPRKWRTLEHRTLRNRRSSVLSMAHQFESVNKGVISKSRSLNRLRSSELRSGPTRRTSVREMAQLYDTMARDNSLDQLTQRDNSLSRSTSYIRKKALQRVTDDLTPLHSTQSSARASPQPYMNVSLSPAYENSEQLMRKPPDPYEEVFFSRPNSQCRTQLQKRPETGERFPSDNSLSPAHSCHSHLSLTNQSGEFPQPTDLMSAPLKPRAATIVTALGEEEFSEEALGHFFLTYHWTEPADGYIDITSKASRRLCRGHTSEGAGVKVSVFRTRVSLSGTSGLPASLQITDLIAFQSDPEYPSNVGMLVRAGSEFQLLFFSAADGQSADQLILTLREATHHDPSSSLIGPGQEDHFALLLGCSQVSAGVGKVAQGVEQTLATHKLSQILQVRIDMQDGFQVFPFGRSEPLCGYRRNQLKSAGVWERDPRVLGVVLQLRPSRHICYAFRFNRANQLIAAFSHIRHLCQLDAGEDGKKQRAGFLKGLFGKQTSKPRSSSDTSRGSTPPVDQMDSDAFTLLFLGATEPSNATLTPECVLREYDNLLAGRNVAENVSPAPTTILTVSDSCVRVTDRDKAVFRRRVYQRRTVLACARAERENVLALLTERPGTQELKCSLFRPVFCEAGLVSAHINQRLELNL